MNTNCHDKTNEILNFLLHQIFSGGSLLIFLHKDHMPLDNIKSKHINIYKRLKALFNYLNICI